MDYYDAIANGYDKLHGHEQARKFKLVLSYLEIGAKETVLDVGCGTGLAYEHIKSPIVGIDPSNKLLKIAQNRLYQVTAGTAEDLPFRTRSFDYVIAMTSVHNFPDYRIGLEEIERVCKQTAVISVLKKSKSFNEINTAISEIYRTWDMISIDEDEHDLITILTRKQ